MRKLIFVLCFGLATGCAATSRPSAAPSARAAAQVRQREAMRRATRTVASHLDTTTCLMHTADAARSLLTSDQCLSCHDGVSGPSVGSHTHPTSIVYATSAKNTMLRPQVADGIVLVDGTVQCTSCHDPASTLPSSTALTLDRSTLCLGCHVH